MLFINPVPEQTKQKAIAWCIGMREAIAKIPDYPEKQMTVKPERQSCPVFELEEGTTIKFKGKFFSVISNKSVGDYQMLELLRRGRTMSVAVPKEIRIERLF